MVVGRGSRSGGTDIDDSPPAPLDHSRQTSANHAKRAGQIDIDDLVPGAFVVAADRLVGGDSGGVDQDVRRSMQLFERGDESLDTAGIGDVERVMKKIRAGRPQLSFLPVVELHRLSLPRSRPPVLVQVHAEHEQQHEDDDPLGDVGERLAVGREMGFVSPLQHQHEPDQEHEERACDSVEEQPGDLLEGSDGDALHVAPRTILELRSSEGLGPCSTW